MDNKTTEKDNSIKDSSLLKSENNKQQLEELLTENEKDQFIEKLERPLTKKEKSNLAKTLAERQEDTRALLARKLVFLLSITISATIIIPSLGAFYIKDNEPQIVERKLNYLKDVTSSATNIQVGLIGAVIGFYFGANTKQNTKN